MSTTGWRETWQQETTSGVGGRSSQWAPVQGTHGRGAGGRSKGSGAWGEQTAHPSTKPEAPSPVSKSPP